MAVWNTVKTFVGDNYGKLVTAAAVLGIGYGVWQSDRFQAWMDGDYYCSNRGESVRIKVDDDDAREALEDLLFDIGRRRRMGNTSKFFVVKDIAGINSPTRTVTLDEVLNYRNNKCTEERIRTEEKYGLRR